MTEAQRIERISELMVTLHGLIAELSASESKWDYVVREDEGTREIRVGFDAGGILRLAVEGLDAPTYEYEVAEGYSDDLILYINVQPKVNLN